MHTLYGMVNVAIEEAQKERHPPKEELVLDLDMKCLPTNPKCQFTHIISDVIALLRVPSLVTDQRRPRCLHMLLEGIQETHRFWNMSKIFWN